MVAEARRRNAGNGDGRGGRSRSADGLHVGLREVTFLAPRVPPLAPAVPVVPLQHLQLLTLNDAKLVSALSL